MLPMCARCWSFLLNAHGAHGALFAGVFCSALVASLLLALSCVRLLMVIVMLKVRFDVTNVRSLLVFFT